MPRHCCPYREAQHQQALWTPRRDLARLLLWLDAADLSTLSGATGISQWRDKSPAGRTADNATGANQPTLDVTTMNGRPSLRFNGTSQYLALSSNLDITGGNWTAFVCYQIENAATDRPLMGRMTGATVNGNRFLAATSDTQGANPYGLSAFGFSAGTTIAENLFTEETLNVPRIASFSPFGSTQHGRTLTRVGVAQTINIVTINEIGAAMRSSIRALMQGVIAEIVIYNSQLSVIEEERVVGYLAWKYGTASADLVEGSTYKNKPPLTVD